MDNLNRVDEDISGSMGIRTLDGVQGLYEIKEVVRNGYGHILYLVDEQGLLVPWNAIMLLHKLDPSTDVVVEDEAIVQEEVSNG